MKVGFDVSPLKTGHKTRGIGSYTSNLFKHLKLSPSLEVQEFTNSNEIKNVDVIHIPYFDLFFNTLKINKNIPTVVTIHDVTPLLFPENYPPGIKGKINYWFQKKAIKQVDAIITDSENSKKDIQKFLGIDPSKIFVIFLAQGENFKVLNDKSLLNKIKQKYNLPDIFALFTGNVNWNKNILNTAKACIDAGTAVYFVGKSFESKDNLNHPELKSYSEFLENYSNHPKIHTLGYVSDEDLVGIYNLASVTLLPSFYEGFGITILESQACGTPVITSNISSMPEVGGNGCLYVDPYDHQSIKEAILKILSDNSLKARLIKDGFSNVRKFLEKHCS